MVNWYRSVNSGESMESLCDSCRQFLEFTFLSSLSLFIIHLGSPGYRSAVFTIASNAAIKKNQLLPTTDRQRALTRQQNGAHGGQMTRLLILVPNPQSPIIPCFLP